MFIKPWDVSNTPHNLEKHISYFRKCVIISTCSKMGDAYTSIIDLSLCPFFSANCCYPFLPKFRLLLLRWNSIEFQRALFRSSIRATKCTAGIWHVLILNVKMKSAENWNWPTSRFLQKCYLMGRNFSRKKIWQIWRFWQKSAKLNSAIFKILGQPPN